MPVGDIYQVTCKGRVNNNDCVNVWYMRATDANVDGEQVADGFFDEVLTPLAAAQSVNYEWYEIIARNLFDQGDQYIQSIALAGSATSSNQSMPLHDAYGVILEHDNPAIRKGAKRFGGINEAGSDDYGAIPSATIAQWDTLLNDIVGDPITYTPVAGAAKEIGELVVVQSIIEIVAGVTGYRLPTTLVEAVWGVVTNAIMKPNVTTQVSRKVGVGS